MTTSSSIKALLIALTTLAPIVAYAQGGVMTQQMKPSAGVQTNTTGSVNAAQIDVNTASEIELGTLLQGSEGKAQADANAKLIISKRPFASVEDLGKILDKKTFDAIKGKVAVK